MVRARRARTANATSEELLVACRTSDGVSRIVETIESLSTVLIPSVSSSAELQPLFSSAMASLLGESVKYIQLPSKAMSRLQIYRPASDSKRLCPSVDTHKPSRGGFPSLASPSLLQPRQLGCSSLSFSRYTATDTQFRHLRTFVTTLQSSPVGCSAPT